MTDTNNLRRLAEAATPGPWAVDDKSKGELWVTDEPHIVPVCMVTASGNISERDKADAAFIAAANPSVILELLAERDKMREALKIAEAALEQAQDCIRGETPEDMSAGEAEDDTFSKIRTALSAINTALHQEGRNEQTDEGEGCDCQNPVEANVGAAGVSEHCPIHNRLTEADEDYVRRIKLTPGASS